MQTEQAIPAMRPSVRPAAGGGVAGNARLTGGAAALLLVLLALEGATIPLIGRLVGPHIFIGMLLIPPVLLKLASTGYRFARYYTGAPPYRRKGPPPLAMRLLAPGVVATTFALFATGVWLLVEGPKNDTVVFLHKASFVAWFALMTVHVLGHVLELPRLAAPDWRRAGAAPTGAAPAAARPRWPAPACARASSPPPCSPAFSSPSRRSRWWPPGSPPRPAADAGRSRIERTPAAQEPEPPPPRRSEIIAPFGAWRSLVARTVRVGEVPGSNPGAPTKRPSFEPPPEEAAVCVTASRPSRAGGSGSTSVANGSAISVASMSSSWTTSRSKSAWFHWRRRCPGAAR